MALKDIQDQVDTKLATLWTTLQTHQDAFFAANGRYKQFLRSHTVTPADGTETLPDIGATKPSYELSGYPAALRNTAIPFCLEVHQYQCPDGQKGYHAMVTVTVAGETYLRTAQVGPETWRQHGWRKVEQNK